MHGPKHFVVWLDAANKVPDYMLSEPRTSPDKSLSVQKLLSQSTLPFSPLPSPLFVIPDANIDLVLHAISLQQTNPPSPPAVDTTPPATQVDLAVVAQ